MSPIFVAVVDTLSSILCIALVCKKVYFIIIFKTVILCNRLTCKPLECQQIIFNRKVEYCKGKDLTGTSSYFERIYQSRYTEIVLILVKCLVQ